MSLRAIVAPGAICPHLPAFGAILPAKSTFSRQRSKAYFRYNRYKRREESSQPMPVTHRQLAREATVEDLYRVTREGKVEIVNRRIFYISPDGEDPGNAAFAIALCLKAYEAIGKGRTYTSTVVFTVNLPNQKSFSPDASFYVGPRAGMHFLSGAPLFAVETRSENDYGPAAECVMAAKRADYFAAGTKVVWDVNLVGDETVRKYRKSAPYAPSSSGAAKLPTLNPHCRVGQCRLMVCFCREIRL